jgi:hypothetical protein
VRAESLTGQSSAAPAPPIRPDPALISALFRLVTITRFAAAATSYRLPR